MSREPHAIGQPKFVHLLVDRFDIRPLTREYEGKRLAALGIARTAFEDALNVLFPVHLAAIEQDRFVRQIVFFLCRRRARRAGLDVRRTVWHHDHFADIAVVIERLFGALADRPDFVAALIEIHNAGDADVCEHLRLGQLIKIVIIARMEHADHRDSASAGEALRLHSRDEWGMRVDDVQLDVAHACVIVRVQLRNAGAVLLLTRQFPADELNQLKGIPAAKAGIRHRGYHITFFATAGKRGGVVIDHAAYAIDNR